MVGHHWLLWLPIMVWGSAGHSAGSGLASCMFMLLPGAPATIMFVRRPGPCLLWFSSPGWVGPPPFCFILFLTTDVNECTNENGDCEDQCCNTIGSYYCRCPAGQKLGEDGKSCKDIDECVVLNGSCQQRCVNTQGSFSCECEMGYRLHADERTCIMIDPCASGNGGCSHICQNERGFAKCECHPGHYLSADKKSCGDIDECAEVTARCAYHCVNTLGSFSCVCNPGFELGADGKQCYRIEMEIVNSCESNNGGCSHHCEHSTNGPHCSCNRGYLIDLDGKTCIDLDECEIGEACCSQFCINYVGGYECSCKAGFQLSVDGCGCDALDDDELEEEEVEIARFPDLRFRRPPQLLHYTALRGELTLVHKVVCLDNTFGHDCSLDCEDCMNGGKCNSETSGCFCPPGWTGIICNESEYSTVLTTFRKAPEPFFITL
uniref:EGF-like domain-containing protein n=1 Tax=Sphenodon punctatus TaxID=8508 RepID=A0A8D0L9S5_SPHPU